MSHFIVMFFYIPPCYLKTNARSWAAQPPVERWTERARGGSGGGLSFQL